MGSYTEGSRDGTEGKDAGEEDWSRFVTEESWDVRDRCGDVCPPGLANSGSVTGF